MMCHRLTLFLLVLVISMLNLSKGDPIPRKGKGRKAFGAGLLTGALAGAIAGKVLANKVPSTKSETNKHVTKIQNGPILANGCFEQTIRESDSSKLGKFVETVYLVCPSAVPLTVLTPVSAVVQTPMPQTPISQIIPMSLSPPILMPEQTPAQLPIRNGPRPNPASDQLGFPVTVLTPVSAVVQTPIPQAIPMSLSPPVLMPEQTPAQLPIGNGPRPIPASDQLGFVNTALLPQIPQPAIQVPEDTSNTISQQIQPLTHQNRPQMIPEATVQLNSQISSHVIPPHIPQIISQIAIAQTPQVYVISKRIEYNNKKSAAMNSILGNKYLMQISIILLMLFM